MAIPDHIFMQEWVADKPLPSEHDFDPFGGCLDAQSAWRHFGGLTRTQANERFQENPLRYQEDFMFMGGVAFAYYYPVIERFLCDARVADECVDRQAWILAWGIMIQFRTNGGQLRHLVPPILALAKHVRNNLAAYDPWEGEQVRIDTAWNELESSISNHAT